MSLKPQPNADTVSAIVDLATVKCFDWAQGSIAETMAEVASQLAVDAVRIKHELMEEDA